MFFGLLQHFESKRDIFGILVEFALFISQILLFNAHVQIFCECDDATSYKGILFKGSIVDDFLGEGEGFTQTKPSIQGSSVQKYRARTSPRNEIVDKVECMNPKDAVCVTQKQDDLFLVAVGFTFQEIRKVPSFLRILKHLDFAGVQGIIFYVPAHRTLPTGPEVDDFEVGIILLQDRLNHAQFIEAISFFMGEHHTNTLLRVGVEGVGILAFDHLFLHLEIVVFQIAQGNVFGDVYGPFRHIPGFQLIVSVLNAAGLQLLLGLVAKSPDRQQQSSQHAQLSQTHFSLFIRHCFTNYLLLSPHIF